MPIDPKVAQTVRERVRDVLSGQPFRDSPNFDDLVEVASEAALHVAHAILLASGDVVTKVLSLETRLVAQQSAHDGLEASLREAVKRIGVLEAVGASQRQAAQQDKEPPPKSGDEDKEPPKAAGKKSGGD